MKLLHHAAKKDWEDVDKAPAAQQSTVCWARFKKKSKFRAKTTIGVQNHQSLEILKKDAVISYV